MKKIYSLFMLISMCLTLNAQLVINENFTPYTTGPLGNQGGWVQSGSGTDVQVSNVTPTLTYPGYIAGGNYVTVTATNGTDPYKPFSLGIPTTSNTTVFMSFLVNASSVKKDVNSVYSISLRDTVTGATPAEFYIAQNNSGTNIAFGIATGNSAPVYTSYLYNYSTTYLIVIRYDIMTGSNNDNTYLWVNPSLATEPSTGAPAAQQIGGEVTYGSTFNALQITQSSSSSSPVAAYDAFRVAFGPNSSSAWSNLIPPAAPLPVLLTSLNASLDGNAVKLVWNTADEYNVTSYTIEKSNDGRTFTAIGSVAATNQKTYIFSDGQYASLTSYYRLKVTDENGSYKYSYIVSVKSKAEFNLTLSPNPVKGMLLVQHPKATDKTHLQVFSADGKLMKDLLIPANSVLTNVDLSPLPTGLYHVVFRSLDNIFNKPVLKQ